MQSDTSFFYITLNDIRIFLHCAECSNFTRAAKELGYTTGMVSKRIAFLENSIGAPLFIREKNKVILSKAGMELKLQWKDILQNFSDSVAKAKEITSGENDPIVFGLGRGTNLDRYFMPLVSSFDSPNGNFAFKVVLSDSFDMTRDVKQGKIDIMFAPYFMEKTVKENAELDCFLALPSPLYACLSDGNPLVDKEEIVLQDLKNLSFIMPDTVQQHSYVDWMKQICAENGVTMKTEHIFSASELPHLLVKDDSVFVTDQYYTYFQSASLNFRKIKDTQSGLLIIWNRDSSPRVTEFIQHTRNFCKEISL